jgi:hypothetical protein
MWALRAVAALVVLPIGCSDGDSGSVRSPVRDDGGTEAAAAATFGGSPCASCIETECASEITACGSEPDCAAAWERTLDCGTAENGDVLAECAEGAGSGGAELVALTACRTAAPCAACGRVASGDASDAPAPEGSAPPSHPILEQVCAPSVETNECWKCEDEKCCDTHAACTAEPACGEYRECMLGCTERYTCPVTCEKEVPAGYALFTTRLACVTVRCAAECADLPPSPCEVCTNRECAVTYAACKTDLECARLWDCQTPCTTAACRDACGARFPGALPSLEAFAACAANRCIDVCG